MLKKHVSFAIIVLFSSFSAIQLQATEPPKLKITNQTETSVSLSWPAVPGISDYKVSYGTDNQATKHGATKVSNTSHILKALQPGTIYYVKIRNFSEKENEPWSPTLKFSTQIPILTNLKSGNVQDTSVDLIWSSYNKELAYIEYDVSYGADQAASSLQQAKTKKTEFSLTGLEPDKKYYAKIRARNPLVDGPWSKNLVFSTLPYSPGERPTDLRVIRELPAKVKVTWKKVKSADGYELAYGTDPVLHKKKIVSTGNNKYTFHLSPSTEYYFKVRSIYQKRPSYWSPSVMILTHPARPEKLRVTGQTVDQVMLTWQADKNPKIPQVYRLRWNLQAVGGSAHNTYTAYTNFTFNELEQGRPYSVKIKTLNEKSSSAWSSPHTIKTLPKFKSEIKSARLTATTAVLKWPSYPNARMYELSYGTDVEARNKLVLPSRSSSLCIKELNPGLTYYVKVRAVLNDQTYGSWSGISSFTTHTLPDQLSQPTIIKTAANYVQLVWGETENTAEYELMLLTELNSVAGKMHRFKKIPARLEGLKPNTEYRVKVRALNPGGTSPWSKVLTFVTNLKQAPSGLRVNDVITTGAIVRWNDSEGNIKNTYEVRFTPKGEDWIINSNIHSPSHDLSDLYPYTTYYVQVRAENRNGFSPWSSSVSFQTLIAPPGKHPAGLEASQVKDISAFLEWERMSGIKGYHLSIGMNMDAGDREINVQNTTLYVLKKMMPDQAYYVKIRAFNSSGEGPWSEPLLLKTLPSPPIVAPLDVAILEVTTDSIGLLWKTFGKAIHYEVIIGTHPEANNLGDPTTANYPPHTFTGLKAKTTYYVKVRNVNRGGSGPWSKILKATTEEEE
ncbi:fibronectin type III domain-containing protein [bacterium]|nr:fibronectin type III domain-containing protein [bacterium]